MVMSLPSEGEAMQSGLRLPLGKCRFERQWFEKYRFEPHRSRVVVSLGIRARAQGRKTQAPGWQGVSAGEVWAVPAVQPSVLALSEGNERPNGVRGRQQGCEVVRSRMDN